MNGATRQMIYDIFGQNIGDYRNGLVERENIYRGGQLLAVVEAASAAAPAGLAAAPSGGGVSVALSWSAASGATNYRVERKGANSSYVLAATTTSTSLTDSGVSSGSAYLYRVCAADGQGNCTSGYSNAALGAAVSFSDPTIITFAENPTNATAIKAAHITELRSAVNAVRSLAGLAAATWTNATLTPGVSVISADEVRDLRTKLDEALMALGLQTSSYTDATLATGQNGTIVKRVHITELRQRATSGSGAQGSGGTSGGLMYVLSDLQGSARAVMNNNGVGTSTIIARHDYLPFGEEIGAGTGLRTSAQGYGASDTNRWKYGMLERDSTTGLDHTWWRKYENTSGRWTSPDPYRGSMAIANPQSFNRYSYVQNDPVNFVDPSGLYSSDYWNRLNQSWFNGHGFNAAYNSWNLVPRITEFEFFHFHAHIGDNVYEDYYIASWGFMLTGRPQKPLDNKEIQRRIAEGKAWDKWYAWVNCNTPIMNKYNAQINDFLKIGGEALWWEVGAGLAAGTTVFGAGIAMGSGGGVPGTATTDDGLPVGAWGAFLIIVGVHAAERKRINDIKSEYQKEVTKNCGPKPPHP